MERLVDNQLGFYNFIITYRRFARYEPLQPLNFENIKSETKKFQEFMFQQVFKRYCLHFSMQRTLKWLKQSWKYSVNGDAGRRYMRNARLERVNTSFVKVQSRSKLWWKLLTLCVIVFEHPRGFWQSLDAVITNACQAKVYFLFATAILSLLLVIFYSEKIKICNTFSVDICLRSLDFIGASFYLILIFIWLSLKLP